VEDLARRAVTQANGLAWRSSRTGGDGVRLDDPYLVTLWRMGSEISSHADVPWRGASSTCPALSCDRRWRILRLQRAERSDRSGEDVYIVGGGELGWTGGDVLLEYARKVTMLVRSDSLAKSMSHLIAQISAQDNITSTFALSAVL